MGTLPVLSTSVDISRVERAEDDLIEVRATGMATGQTLRLSVDLGTRMVELSDQN